ncbi:hypothetical protein Tco_1556373 [Tanacetum coccineum]
MGDANPIRTLGDYSKPSHDGYLKETMGYYFYFSPENKLLLQEFEEIQDGDTSTSENTSEHLVKADSLEPQEDVAPIHRSVMIHQSPEHLCLNVEVKEHSLGDVNELTNYKVALSDPSFGKCLML